MRHDVSKESSLIERNDGSIVYIVVVGALEENVRSRSHAVMHDDVKGQPPTGFLYIHQTTTCISSSGSFQSQSVSTMAPNDNFISRAVQNGVATAGGYAGGVVDAAGKGVSGAGRNVGNR